MLLVLLSTSPFSLCLFSMRLLLNLTQLIFNGYQSNRIVKKCAQGFSETIDRSITEFFCFGFLRSTKLCCFQVVEREKVTFCRSHFGWLCTDAKIQYILKTMALLCRFSQVFI